MFDQGDSFDVPRMLAGLYYSDEKKSLGMSSSVMQQQSPCRVGGTMTMRGGIVQRLQIIDPSWHKLTDTIMNSTPLD